MNSEYETPHPDPHIPCLSCYYKQMMMMTMMMMIDDDDDDA